MVMGRFERGILGLLITILLAGCEGLSSEPGDIVTGGPFPIIERQAYQADAPAALLTLADSGSGAERGTVRGVIHGWPFAHADPGGDFGEGLFTCQIDFVVTARAANGAKLPTRARGTRTVYFHPDREPISIGQAAAFSSGQPIITDSVELTFSFDSADNSVRVTSVMHQTGVRTFNWNDQSVTPPDSGPQTAEASGTYSAQLGGYVFTSEM